MAVGEKGSDMYLDLLKHCLVNTIYGSYEYSDFKPWDKVKQFLFQMLFMPLFGKHNAKVVALYNYDENKRIQGRDWSPMAHTMIGLKRLDNIQYCVEEVIKNNAQ